MIAILQDQHMRQKPGSGNAALDRAARRLGLHDPFAARTGQLRSNLTDHFESRQHVLQDFRYAFAKKIQLPTAVRTNGLLRQIPSHFPP
jgi:hypothetical protein